MITWLTIVYGKKERSFAEKSKNLVRYKFENNFVGLAKQLRKSLKLDEQYCKKF